MKFISSEYFNKEYLKSKAKRIAKTTWAGPGKFGVFIVLCIIVVATFESLGLSNRERNLEFRNLSNMVIAFEGTDPSEISYADLNQSPKIKNLDSQELNHKIKIFTQKDIEDKNIERNKMLLSAAVDQYIYENNENENVRYLSQEEKIRRIYVQLMRENGCEENNNEEKVAKEDFFFDI